MKHKTSDNRISSPLIIDPTVGKLTEKLKTACQKFGISVGMDVTVRIRAGNTVKSDAKSEPLRRPECGREKCMCCSTGNPGNCEKNYVGYRITCETCQRAGIIVEYEGESGRNAYSRGLEHQQGLRDEKEDSPLWKHCHLLYEGVKHTFLTVVLRSFRSCMERQIDEAVRISSSQATVLMKSKSEFHQAPMVRVVVTSGLHSSQGEEEGYVPIRRPRGGTRGTRGRGGRGQRRGLVGIM